MISPDDSTTPSAPAAVGERVVLLHGLSPLPFALRPLQSALCRAGFRPLPWRYPSRRHDVATLVRRFRAWLAMFEGATAPIHFVGFSLGAILIRAGLGQPVDFPLGRVVMIAPPNDGANLVARLRHLAWLSHIYGRPALEFTRGDPWLGRLPTPACPIGVIAGTRRLHAANPNSWLNALLGNAEAHDGTVEVASTQLAGMRDFTTVDATHTLITRHPETIRQVIGFLRDGRFAPGVPG